MFEGITVNGVALAEVVDAEDRKEKQDFRAQEITIMGKTIRAHATTNKFKNHSGAKTGKGRVLFTKEQGWLVPQGGAA